MTIQQDWPAQVHKYWFDELSREDWYVKNNNIDQQITERFLPLYEQLAQRDVDQHLANSERALAAIIVLDQFPRNMFRGSAKSFASDDKALKLSIAAVAANLDNGLNADERQFLYMPHMHSEDPAMQKRCVELFESFNDEHLLGFAVRHKQIIDRFGRFPHRNEVLGRASTPQEVAFLTEPGSSF